MNYSLRKIYKCTPPLKVNDGRMNRVERAALLSMLMMQVKIYNFKPKCCTNIHRWTIFRYYNGRVVLSLTYSPYPFSAWLPWKEVNSYNFLLIYLLYRSRSFNLPYSTAIRTASAATVFTGVNLVLWKILQYHWVVFLMPPLLKK